MSLKSVYNAHLSIVALALHVHQVALFEQEHSRHVCGPLQVIFIFSPNMVTDF